MTESESEAATVLRMRDEVFARLDAHGLARTPENINAVIAAMEREAKETIMARVAAIKAERAARKAP